MRLTFLIKYLLRFKGQVAAILLSSFALPVLMLSFGIVLKDIPLIINDSTPVTSFFYKFFGLATMFVAASLIRIMHSAKLAIGVYKQITEDLYSAIIDTSPIFFHTTSKVKIASLFFDNISKIYDFLLSKMSYFFRNIFTVLFGITLMIATSIRMFAVTFAVVVVISVVRKFFSLYLKRSNNAATHAGDILRTHISETINFNNVVRINGQQAVEKSTLSNMLIGLSNLIGVKSNHKAVNFAVLMMLSLLGIMVILVIGATDVRRGVLNSADMVVFFYYAILVSFSAIATIEAVIDFGDVHLAINAIEDTVKNASSLFIHSGQLYPQKLDISFNNVHFAYPERPGVFVLNGANFTIPYGKKVAIVGDSGAGKSTIIDLLTLSYKPTSGSITVGDIDISQINVTKLYADISIVPQDNAIFSRSIWSNITYGNANIDKLQIDAMIDKFRLSELLTATKFGTLGEMGSEISSGEKQRIANARALLKRDAKIFIFDESFSALDKINRDIIMGNIMEVTEGKTVIFITHHIDEWASHFDTVLDITKL
jgi:ATP-binding cassette subfamily B protein